MGSMRAWPGRLNGWFDAARITAYLRVLLAMQALAALAWLGLARHMIDRMGKPVGTDFLSFWAAGRLALQGHPLLAYSVPAHLAAEHAALLGYAGPYYAFFYPPPFLLVCAALALLPYTVALLAWLGGAGLACWGVVRRLGRDSADGVLSGRDLPFFAFPALWITLGHGQNAFLTTALFGVAMQLWDRRPVAAGLAAGLLSMKPHLGVLLPVAALAGRRWRIIIGAAISAAALAGLTTLAFGPAIWTAFLAQSHLARIALERRVIGADRMVSVFAAVQVLHGGVGLAWTTQILAGLGAALPLAWRAARPRRPGGVMAATITGTLLATPFLLDYDLMLLILPLAWMVRGRPRQAIGPAEAAILGSAYLLPLLARPVAGGLGLPLAPFIVGLLHWQVLRRAAAPG